MIVSFKFPKIFLSENFPLYGIPPSKWETNFTFINNTVRRNKNSIFASTLQPCIRAYSAGEIELFDNKPFYHYPNNNDTKISTLPVKFKLLNSSICSVVSNKAFNGLICSIVPGEIFDIPLIMEDELGEKVDSIMLIATCTESRSPNVLLPYQVTNRTIQIAGKPSETCHLQLQADTRTDYPISTIIEVNMLIKLPPRVNLQC